MPGIGLGIGKCPYDPADNSTAVYVEKGNPFGLPALVRFQINSFFFFFVICFLFSVFLFSKENLISSFRDSVYVWFTYEINKIYFHNYHPEVMFILISFIQFVSQNATKH